MHSRRPSPEHPSEKESLEKEEIPFLLSKYS